MAIKLARYGLESTSPNPRVGCVITRDRQVLATGWHRQAGGPHAEIEALNAIGGSANGATAYVTLEPCAHHGRTGPCVEALIAAYEATRDTQFLTRAKQIAYQFCVVLAGQSEKQIWEHYDTSWQADWQYNIDKPDDLFKPWGFQPGHQIEWAKLLLQLDQISPEDWYLKTAIRLFDTAMEKGWDTAYGGLVYGYGPDGRFADAHKYFWVQAEAIATSWRLYQRTEAKRYQADYHRLWQWSWDHLIDHQYGGWYRITSQEGNWIEPYKSPAGKVDYHTMGACWDILSVMGKHSLSH